MPGGWPSVIWGYKNYLARCPLSSSRVVQPQSPGGGSRVPSTARGQAPVHKCFKVSACVRFAHVPLAKESHRTQPRVKRWKNIIHLLMGWVAKSHCKWLHTGMRRLRLLFAIHHSTWGQIQMKITSVWVKRVRKGFIPGCWCSILKAVKAWIRRRRERSEWGLEEECKKECRYREHKGRGRAEQSVWLRAHWAGLVGVKV